MKTTRLMITGVALSLALITGLSYVGCGGSKSSSGSSVDTTAKITISGTLAGGTHAKIKSLNFFDRFFARLFSAPALCALTAADVAKVIGFNQRGSYFITTVDENDTFSIQVDQGYPTALIFIDAADHYLGYLTLSNGIDSLPLAKLADTVTMTEFAAIDLALNGLPFQSYTIPPIEGESVALVSFIAAIIDDGGQIRGVLIGRADLASNPLTQPVLGTLASMANVLNRTKALHLLTLEDPIEYVFPTARCVVTQREIGVDVPPLSLGPCVGLDVAGERHGDEVARALNKKGAFGLSRKRRARLNW